ncbi:MAG: ferrous iron transport protein A [Acidobacteria bacterium]|nr:ferrous iron transport protein A [Acidobacteriota bacterium]MCB9378453.1 ferrous iron transport protein A [Holophagales bacterium]
MPERSEDLARASEGRLAVVRLVDLPCGVVARLEACELPPFEAKLLAAMGLALGSRLVVRAQGDPTIVEVRATRIGLARSVAERLAATPETPEPQETPES